jgi:hypothetical protein
MLDLHFFTGHIKSPIFTQKNTNPISLRTTIPALRDVNRARTDLITHAAADPVLDPRDAYLRETMPSYVVVGKYLLSLLTVEIRVNSVPDVFNNYEDAESIVLDFRRQFAAYTCQEMPFVYSPDTEPYNYWKKLASNKDASVLAVRHLSFLLI